MKPTTECRMNIMKSVGMNLLRFMYINLWKKKCRLFAWFCCICFMDSLFFSGTIFDRQASPKDLERWGFIFCWPMGTMEVHMGCWILWGITSDVYCIHIIINLNSIYLIFEGLLSVRNLRDWTDYYVWSRGIIINQNTNCKLPIDFMDLDVLFVYL